MNQLADRMMSLDKSLTMHNEGEWSGSTSTYSAFNSGGVENEVGEFLYSLLRMIKPDFVLETGTHLGVGASYMGLALKDNFKGMLETIEYIPELHAQAQERINKLELTKHVTCHLMDVANFPTQHNYQVVLLDTEPQTRFAEFLKFYPYVDEGGYMFIHDLGRELQQKEIPNLGFAWPFGVLPDGMKQLMIDGKIRPFHFGTPRGLSGFYKVHPQDYSWR